MPIHRVPGRRPGRRWFTPVAVLVVTCAVSVCGAVPALAAGAAARPGRVAAGGPAPAGLYRSGYLAGVGPAWALGGTGPRWPVPGIARAGIVGTVASPSAGRAAAHPVVAGRPGQADGGWGPADKIRGGSGSQLISVSCGSAGNCSAGGGGYLVPARSAAIVASEVNGAWGAARQVPGLAGLGTLKASWIFSVSCASAGNCSAGGAYIIGRQLQGFVVTQAHGVWGNAAPVPGLAALNVGHDAQVSSVSCAGPGECTAVGTYALKNTAHVTGRYEAFVASQVHGHWGTARTIPGLNALNKGTYGIPGAVSCTAPGDCTVAGIYSPGFHHVLVVQGFVASQVDGTWQAVQQIPGLAALNKGESAQVDSVSCAAPGDCMAGGSYATSSQPYRAQAFVASQVHGTWHAAQPVPGLAALNKGRLAGALTVSCAAPGDCSAGGNYTDASGGYQAWIADQVHGTWHTAKEFPGTAALNTGGTGATGWLSCPGAGACSAVGWYYNGHNTEPFVATQAHGTWHTAQRVRGLAALDQGGFGSLNAVSCSPEHDCGAVGVYTKGQSHRLHAFAVSQTSP